jgi:hypothetical protein
MVAPKINTWGPTGATEAPDVNVYWTCTDDVQVDIQSLDMTLTPPGGGSVDVLKNGVWQGVYNGTIVANAGNGYDITMTTHPPFIVGFWQVLVDCADFDPLSDQQAWSFTVTADPPTLDVYEPSGFTSSMDRIYCKISDDWGFDTSTLILEAIPPVGPALTGISGGAVQSGWAGSIIGIDDPGTGPREVLINLTSWPELATPQLWTFRVSCETIVETSL